MTEFMGLQVLVVEDESVLAMTIEDMLEDLGCKLVASVGRLEKAQDVASTAIMDFALLDVNLHGQSVFPVAEILRERQVPFVFTTGYGASGLPPEFSSHPVLGKPFTATELQKVMISALKR